MVHNRDAVAETCRLFHVMCCQENRAAAGAEFLDDVPQRKSCLRIETCSRLVEKQEFRIADERTGNGESLFLAARKLSDSSVPFLLERDSVNNLVNVVTAFVETAKQPQRLDNRHLLGKLCFLQLNSDPLAQRLIVPRIPMLAQQFDRPFIRRRQPLEYLDSCRLPRPIWPKQAKTLPNKYFEIKSINGSYVRK